MRELRTGVITEEKAFERMSAVYKLEDELRAISDKHAGLVIARAYSLRDIKKMKGVVKRLRDALQESSNTVTKGCGDIDLESSGL